MQFDHDIVRMTFAYQGQTLLEGGSSPYWKDTVDMPVVYGTPLAQPGAVPDQGFYRFEIPADLQRALQSGRSHAVVTRVWTGVFDTFVPAPTFSSTNTYLTYGPAFEREDIILYSNISEAFTFDSRTYTPSSAIWRGNAIKQQDFFYHINSNTPFNLSNSNTFQTISPLSNTITFKFSSCEDGVQGSQRPVKLSRTYSTSDGGTPPTYTNHTTPISVQIEMAFIVPRISHTTGGPLHM